MYLYFLHYRSGSVRMSTVFYNVIQQDKVIGLWRGLVPVSYKYNQNSYLLLTHSVKKFFIIILLVISTYIHTHFKMPVT